MREVFRAELAVLGDDLVQMSHLVETAITQAGAALHAPDIALAQAVISADPIIDALAADLDERCVLLLAQQQPVATDLRVVVSALRMSGTLERMGDLAVHIAQIARGRYPRLAVGPHFADTFAQMDGEAAGVARRKSALLADRDLAVAARLTRDDDLLDDLHEATFASQLDPAWNGSAQERIDVTLLARYYERFGDHGVSIARRVEYLVTGQFRGPAAG